MIPLYGVPEGVHAAMALVRRLGEHDGPVLHIARDDGRLAGLAEAIGFFGPEIEVIASPAWDCLPYDRVSPNGTIIAERIAALADCQAEPAKKRIRADHGERGVAEGDAKGGTCGRWDAPECRR